MVMGSTPNSHRVTTICTIFEGLTAYRGSVSCVAQLIVQIIQFLGRFAVTRSRGTSNERLDTRSFSALLPGAQTPLGSSLYKNL